MLNAVMSVKPWVYVSRLLGHASAVVGVALALLWGFAFVVIVSHAEYLRATGQPTVIGLRLPVELPMAGAALSLLSLALSRMTGDPIVRPAFVGLIANSIPLVLAAVLVILNV